MKKKTNSTVFNLESYFPTVQLGRQLLDQEMKNCRRQKISVLKIIHGYGSSGKGGNLRIGLRSYLKSLQKQDKIKAFVSGEDFSIFDQTAREILQAAPELRQDRDLERHNHGVTFILL